MNDHLERVGVKQIPDSALLRGNLVLIAPSQNGNRLMSLGCHRLLELRGRHWDFGMTVNWRLGRIIAELQFQGLICKPNAGVPGFSYTVLSDDFTGVGGKFKRAIVTF